MTYLLLLQHEGAERQVADFAAYDAALAAAGVNLGSVNLTPGASLVRFHADGIELVDVPPAAGEHFDSFYLLDVPDLDTAITWAARCPMGRGGSVELRQAEPSDPKKHSAEM